MSASPFAAAAQNDAEPDAHTQTPDLRLQVLGIKKKLEEAATECGSLQNSLVSQHQLEHLLKQGRTHLQDLRGRLQQMTVERDRLNGELNDQTTAHQREVARLQIQVDE